MQVIIEASSEKKLIDQYPEIIDSLVKQKIDYKFTRDEVSSGPGSDLITVGLVFIYETLMSGITYEILKNTILTTIGKLSRDKQKNLYISVKDDKTRQVYEINIIYENEIIEVEIPEKLSFKMKHD